MHFKQIAAVGAAVLGLGFASVPKADAAYIVYLYQDGANVVATGSGSINLAGVTYINDILPSTLIDPSEGVAYLGTLVVAASTYGNLTSTPAFGGGSFTLASSWSGNLVGVDSQVPWLVVPKGYSSGTQLGTSTTTWDNTTLSALGVTDGTYVWTWGTADTADSFTLDAGVTPPTGVPEPASLALLATGLLGLGISRRRAG